MFSNRNQTLARKQYICSALLIFLFAATEKSTEAQTSTSSPPSLKDINLDGELEDFDLSEDEVVTVTGKTIKKELQESAKAVHSVDVQKLHEKPITLGKVLVLTQGVHVRSGAGLGGQESIALNGLTGNRVKVFIDGIPLDTSGYAFGISNIPNNFIQRIDIYRGVVPIALGADALGGALNLTSTQSTGETSAILSYQAGSFDTHRFFGNLELFDPTQTYYFRMNGFIDSTENNYEFKVEEALPFGFPGEGRREEIVARHQNAAYKALGTRIELGSLQSTWTKNASLALYLNRYYNEVPHELTNNDTPFKDVSFGSWSMGAQLRYEQDFFSFISSSLLIAYNHQTNRYHDAGTCTWDWRDLCAPNVPENGEDRDNQFNDLHTEQNALFASLYIKTKVQKNLDFNLSIRPRYFHQTAEDRLLNQSGLNDNSREVLATPREIFNLVSGAELELNILDDRLSNVLFFKSYFQKLSGAELISTAFLVENDRHDIGFGNSLRFKFNQNLLGKLSYEWAIRLPNPEELFGTGDNQIGSNLNLEPSRSHNLNIGFESEFNLFGSWNFSAYGFLRYVEKYIILAGDRVEQPSYQNVGTVQVIGAEGELRWASPGEWVLLSLTGTYLDTEIVDGIGLFGRDTGSRLPNEPYFFGSSSIGFKYRNLVNKHDSLSVTLNSIFVHEFFFGSETGGLKSSKDIIPSQLSHDLSITYKTLSTERELSFSLLTTNITDEELYDYLNIPRAGRAVYFKILLQL